MTLQGMKQKKRVKRVEIGNTEKGRRFDQKVEKGEELCRKKESRKKRSGKRRATEQLL